jgi:hypothetical protein
MARFVSQYKGYTHGVRDAREPYMGLDGKIVPGQMGLEAAFVHEQMDAEAILIAKKPTTEGGLANPDPLKAPFHGMQENEAGREYDITPRLALFDSEREQLKNGWSDSERELVENTLRKSPAYGRHFVEVVPAPVERPWRGYDDVADTDRILELAIAIDADFSQMIAYEKANQNRDEVLEALEAAQAEDETEIVTA